VFRATIPACGPANAIGGRPGTAGGNTSVADPASPLIVFLSGEPCPA